MNTNHFVKHSKLKRDQLHFKRLAIIHADESVQMGHLRVGDEQKDNHYVLMFCPDPIPSTSIAGGNMITTPGVMPPKIVSHSVIQSLEQSIVDRIQSSESIDLAKFSIGICDLVCMMP